VGPIAHLAELLSYRPRERTNRVLIIVGDMMLRSIPKIHTGFCCHPTSLPISIRRGTLFSWGKGRRRDADHLPPSYVEYKYESSYSSIPRNILMAGKATKKTLQIIQNYRVRTNTFRGLRSHQYHIHTTRLFRTLLYISRSTKFRRRWGLDFSPFNRQRK
jgi:hypothetical protein